MNNKGEVAFSAGLRDAEQIGIYVFSNGQISKIVATNDPTPIGGKFGLAYAQYFTSPRINDNGTVAFMGPVAGGSASHAIFLASSKAIIKVAAAGDTLPTGELISSISSFALNDKGQVAFFAYGKKLPIGVFLATPVAPEIKSVKLKRNSGTLELQVKGSAMIINDAVVEINGIGLDALEYPAEFREDGGTTSRAVSLDARLEQLLQPGQMVQVTVFNPLTNQRSAPRSFVR